MILDALTPRGRRLGDYFDFKAMEAEHDDFPLGLLARIVIAR